LDEGKRVGTLDPKGYDPQNVVKGMNLPSKTKKASGGLAYMLGEPTYAEGGRIGLQYGMSPGQAQARGLGAQHHGSTRSWDRTQQTEREGGATAGYVPGIGHVAPPVAPARGDGIIGPLPPGRKETVGGPTPVWGSGFDLTKEKAHEKIRASMLLKTDEETQKKIIDTADWYLKKSNVSPQVYNDILGKLIDNVKIGVVTTERDTYNFLKNKLGGENLPGGPITGGTVSTEIGPLSLAATKNIGDKLDYSAALNLGTPSEKYWAEKNVSPITGKVEYSPDKGLTGDLAANLGIVNAGVNLDNLLENPLGVGWNLGYEGDKVGMGATGTGEGIGKIDARLGSLTGSYLPDTKAWELGIDQSLFQNPDPNEDLRFVGGLGSDDQWNLGLRYSKGIDQRPKRLDYNTMPKEESALKQYLSQFETPTSYEQDIFADKGPPEYFPNVRSRVNWDSYNLYPYAKGGLAKLLGE